jgi:hypothetical protein
MQGEEILRLKKVYEDMSDEGLIESLSEGRESYYDFVYDLILEEAQKKGIANKTSKIEQKEKINEDKKWVAVYRFEDTLVGDILVAMLKEHNIPSVVISNQDSVYCGLFSKSIKQGVIEVREDYAEEARKIIADFEAQSQNKEGEDK